MEYVEKLVVTGYSQNKYILFLLELTDDGNYECRKVLPFTNMEKIAVHSILNAENAIYLADSHNNKIYKYDLCLNEFNETTVGRDPRHMCINNGNIYVTNFESDNISIVDNNSFILAGSIPAGIKPHDIKQSKKDNMLYISCYEENQIIEYDLSSCNSRYINTDGKPMHIYVDENKIIAMTYFVNGNIYSKINILNIDMEKIEDVIKIKGLASDIEYDIRNNFVYVINIEDKSLYVIDTKKRNIIKKIYLGGYPESLSCGAEYIYITNSKKKQITIIDIATLSIYKNIDLGFTPDCIKVLNN